MPAELVDLYPTLCELAGLPIPEHLDGTSLAPSIHDKYNLARKFAISQFPRGQKMGYALRDERYRFVAWFETGGTGAKRGHRITATELYDYATDPLEQRNLSKDPNTKPPSPNFPNNSFASSIPLKISNPKNTA